MQVKLIHIFISISTLSLVYPAITWGQSWQSLNGPIESEVTDIVVQDDTVYAAARYATGIYKRGLNSDDWQYSNIVQGEGAFRHGLESIISIEIGEQGNYYSGGEGIVTIGDGQAYHQFYRSADYGNTWQEFRNGIEYCHTVSDILITSDDDIYITCLRSILSFNEDENRFTVVNETGWGIVHSLYQFQNKILAGTENGLWYTDDKGSNWNETDSEEIEVFAVKFVADEFMIGTDKGLYRTTELTEPWEEVSELSGQAIFEIHPFANSLFLATESGVYTINPNDDSTSPVFPEIDEDSVHVINSSDSHLFIGTETGFYTCTPEQNSCALDGVASAWVRSLDFQGEDTLLTSTTNAVYRYFTETGEWDTQSVPLRRTRNIIPIDEENFYTVDNHNFYRCSFANGECESFEIDEEHVLFDITENNADQLFVASSRYVYQSDDEGETWDTIYTHPNNVNQTLKADGDSLLFINGAIKLSLDTHDFEQLPASVHHISSDGTYYGMGESGVEKSNDSGETWTTLLQSSDIIEPDFIRSVEVDEVNDKIYAISNTGRVYVSENGGEEWGLNTEMRPVSIEQTEIGPDGTLYLGSISAGVFKNSIPISPPITISNEDEPKVTVPGEFTLHQNYPNPFNPSTTITYSLPEPAEVRLTVYNVVGQEVAVLLNGMQNQGVQTVQFDAGHLASGLYLYKLETENYSDTRKMMLVK